MNSAMAPLPADISTIVRLALSEDIGAGDITAQLIPRKLSASARIISKERGILCGSAWVDEVFQQLDRSVQIYWQLPEAAAFGDNQIIALIHGAAQSILTGERTALNFLQTLSGTATLSHYYAALVAHTPVKLLDTRKTLPGLRTAQKYAVRIGGCFNHRMGLFDAFLIKENHISASGGIAACIANAHEIDKNKQVEVEVQNIAQLQQAIEAGADIVMLDNFKFDQIVSAVAVTAGRVKLEASGGIDEDSLVKIAETGVDYISLGSLTKHCRAIDFSLLLV